MEVVTVEDPAVGDSEPTLDLHAALEGGHVRRDVPQP